MQAPFGSVQYILCFSFFLGFTEVSHVEVMASQIQKSHEKITI